jgi:Flp pilus assembly pilin Flp
VVEQHRFTPRNERGQAIFEYAMIVALVGACLVAILGLVGRATNRAYQRTTSAVTFGGSAGYSGGGRVILTGTSSGVRRGGRGSAEPPPDSAAGDESPDSLSAATPTER